MRLYVGNIPFTTDEQDIRDFFAPAQLTEVKIVTDRETGKARGFAFVELEDAAGQHAIETLDGEAMGGRSIRVSKAEERKGGRPNNNRGGKRGDDRRRRDDYS